MLIRVFIHKYLTMEESAVKQDVCCVIHCRRETLCVAMSNGQSNLLQIFIECRSPFVMVARKHFEMDIHSLTAAIAVRFETYFYWQCMTLISVLFWLGSFLSTTALTPCFVATSGTLFLVHTLEIPTNMATSLTVWSWTRPNTISHLSPFYHILVFIHISTDPVLQKDILW